MNNLKRCAFSYLVTAGVFLTLDFIWLSIMNVHLYQPALSSHLAEQYDWIAVAVFYPLYVMGITIFAVRPLETPSSSRLLTIGRAMLLGIVAYGTYDLTNQATLSHWPWALTLIDMAWGAFATGCATWIACIAIKK